MHLISMGLVHIITSENAATSQDRAKAIIFIRHHLDIPLESEYLTVKDSLDLWKELKERFGHLKYITLPKARHGWLNLRLQDLKTVTKYNSAIHQITSQLKLCGEIVTENNKLEKTLSTFHASNIVLQQQYLWPTGSSPFLKANVTFSERGRGRGRGRGRSRGRESQRGRYTPYNHRGQWANTCRTTKHLANLYQDSLQKNEKEVETNHVDNDDDPDDDLLDYDITHLDIANFVVDSANSQ
ncbi:uncharacterized protein LOC127256625 [Andrographis paniculata]|uniref:uncharacterized protein LOC127256625 n=1 Tax=Andrographis paniculata TaxID=175694 RepID=UPI0021E84A63|nr:uncharacterized protein LOC127256625 [Andrographis paniculata]